MVSRGFWNWCALHGRACTLRYPGTLESSGKRKGGPEVTCGVSSQGILYYHCTIHCTICRYLMIFVLLVLQDADHGLRSVRNLSSCSCSWYTTGLSCEEHTNEGEPAWIQPMAHMAGKVETNNVRFQQSNLMIPRGISRILQACSCKPANLCCAISVFLLKKP